MPGSREGASKAAATRLGISFVEYVAHHQNGEKWCTGCRQWHRVERFNVNRSRWDQLQHMCVEARRPYADPKRNIAHEQARHAVSQAVQIGCIASADRVPCSDCGHIGPTRRHHYDHVEGYAPAKRLRVQAVCTLCHADREKARGSYRRKKKVA